MAESTPPAGDALGAAVAVLREAGEPLHWTVIQDRALRAGYLDPFTMRDVRREVLSSLRRGVEAGTLRVAGTGLYELAAAGPED